MCLNYQYAFAITQQTDHYNQLQYTLKLLVFDGCQSTCTPADLAMSTRRTHIACPFCVHSMNYASQNNSSGVNCNNLQNHGSTPREQASEIDPSQICIRMRIGKLHLNRAKLRRSFKMQGPLRGYVLAAT